MAEQILNLEQVRHVAKLSRLAIPDDQLPRFTQQLESILEYVEQIKQADVQGVEPMAHAVRLTNVFRDDTPQPALSTQEVLSNAPETDGPFFKVPKVIGEDDSAG
ncbi:MAG: aspartyl/glutamyl-tRNA(Asn/Gln) amidotransferase subunit C [Phycisphaerae bacterium]|jgi:aspartyl-tRNA(Asn)/glutamyl-tRNA(Gln) amidotransferase subunit C|nr:MAG: aspartyl/glutamyl-tRNA(Asn/Gln) amidotransferase subunit C [Phycisphaerae bacterium]